jgi:hypothetical protein
MSTLTALTALLLLVSFGVAKPGSAAVVPFTGTMSIQIGPLPEVSVAGSGLATVNGSAGGHPITSLVIPAGAFATTALTLPVPNLYPIVQLKFPSLSNRTVGVMAGGSCTASHPNVSCPGGGLAGFGTIQGDALIGIFFTHTAGSFTGTNTVANLHIELSPVGAGSTWTESALGITLQVTGAGWTTGTAGVYNPTAPILTHAPSSFHVFPTVSFYASQSVTAAFGTTRTFMGGRVTGPGSNFHTDAITLVSPVQTFNNAFGEFMPVLATISVHLVPEPGALVLLGTGMAAFLLYGRRLRRR